MRKIIIYITIIFLGISAKAQTFLLLDRNWDKPPILTDSITKAHLNIGLQPIYRADLDTLIILVSMFKDLNRSGLNREYFNADNFKTERFEFLISNFKRAYGDSYDVTFISYAPGTKTLIKLSDPGVLNPTNQQTVRRFLDYLKWCRKKLTDKKKTKIG